MSQKSIGLRGIGKHFDRTQVLAGIDLSVKEGEFLSLVGMSGCGKSTLLRIIAGLEAPDCGSVFIGAEDVTSCDPSDRMHTYHAQLARDMNATRRELGLRRVNGVPRLDLSRLVDAIFTAIQFAFAVKPEVRLVSGRFMAELQEVAWWANQTRFVDEVRLLTEADIDPVDLHNARIIAAVRAPDPWADDAALQAVSTLRGARTLRDLTHELGMAARGYRALLRLIRRGVLRPMRREAITPSTLVLRKEAF